MSVNGQYTAAPSDVASVYIAAIPGHTDVVPRAAGDIYCANPGRTNEVPRAASEMRELRAH